MKEWNFWVSTVLPAVLASWVGVGLAASIQTQTKFWPADSGQLAAWAQAIATVIAVWWTGRYGYWQQQRLWNQEQLDRANAIVVIASMTAGCLKQAFERFESRDSLLDHADHTKTYDFNGVEECLKIVEAIPVHELCTPLLVEHVMRLRSAVRQFSYNMRAGLSRARALDSDEFDRLREILDEASAAAFKLHAAIKEVRQKIASGALPLEKHSV